MHFHYQNLNEKRDDKTGSILRHGRAWLNLSRGSESCPCLGWEWCLPTKSCHLGISFGEPYESTVQFSIGCLLFAFYLTLEGKWGWLPQERECKVAVHNWTLWINPWSKRNEWCGTDPWWVRGLSLDFPDIILGKHNYTDSQISEHSVLVPMPEGCYPATAKISEQTWKRPRWFRKTRISTYISFPPGGGIPHYGKGENSWDCGEDALCGCGVEGESLERAIGHATATALGYRRKYGNASDLIPLMSHRLKQLETQQLNKQPEGNEQSGSTR